MKNDNIAAISTCLGAAGVAVIRISGDSPLNIAEKMFTPSAKIKVCDFVPNKMYAGEILCDGFNDYGMCVYFKAPKSFTGEDTVEFHCHGGLAITQGVLRSALSNGARLATRGEFTRRAFMNGKLSLSSAEGLIDMINSESVGAVKAGYSLYREKLTNEITEIQNSLLDAVGEIDVDIDYPEEDLDVSSRKTAKRILTESVEKITKLLASYRIGRTVKNGVKVGIVGKPNTGKSSILNALLNYDKAIVSDVAGTTRDIVEGSLDINGIRFNLKDTAGIRESDDKIESMGVTLSKKILEESDLVMFVVDGNNLDGEDQAIYDSVKDKNLLVVLNKTDLGGDYDKADVKVSALKKDNIEELRSKIFDKTVGSGIDLNGDFLCEERHFEALKRAKEKLVFALNNVDDAPLDLLEIDVKAGWQLLGEISGETASEEIIDNIFSRFCVGK